MPALSSLYLNCFFLVLQTQFSSSVKFGIALLFLCLSHHSRLTRLAAKINSTQFRAHKNLCRPLNKQATNRRTNMCEREREREIEGEREKENKKKNCRWKKITKLAFKFLLAFCSLQSKQIDSSKRTKHLPLSPLCHSPGNHRASTKAAQTARKPVLDSAAHKC